MTEEKKKALFFQLVAEKMREYRTKELFYKALGKYCGRGMRMAQRWVVGESWPDGDEQLQKMWEFVGAELLDNGNVSIKANGSVEKPTTRPTSSTAPSQGRMVTITVPEDLFLELEKMIHEVRKQRESQQGQTGE